MFGSFLEYWRSDDGVVTIEYSLLFLGITVVAAFAAGRVGDGVVRIVDEAAALFE